jgi:transposase
MFLKKTPQVTGRVHLAIVEGYRKDGKNKARTVESLGYLDEFTDTYEDPIAHFTALAKEMTEREKEKAAPVQITIHPLQKIDKRVSGIRKNIGCAVGLFHYNYLSIERTLRNGARNRRFAYDPNAIMRLLVTERMLNPGSKLSDFANRHNYFFKCDFTEDDLYRSLDFFSGCKDKIIANMNRQIELSGKRDMTSVFYDVTNYYFETDKADDLRKPGVNKDKSKKEKPIVQMGLLQDKNAIPITYKTFAGNTNDCTTLMPTLADLKKRYKLSDVVVVADKGINCSNNIACCILDGNDYIFSQSIRATKSTDELRRWVLSDEGYKSNKQEDYKSKSRQDMKTLHITDDDGKVIKDVDVEVKVVAFWSKKYEVRARKKRAEAIAKARELIKSPSKYNKATHYGAAKYVSNITFDKKTGEVLEDAGKHAVLNEDAIRKAEECDGYYMIITSKTEWSDDEIIDTYRGLWRIEEAFKITKSDIAQRPIFVWTPEHIEAHFLTCYIALTILRLIQFDTDFAYSADVITSELAAMSGTHEEGAWWLFDHRTNISDELCASVGIDLARKRMRLQEIKSVLTQVNGKDPKYTT